MNTEKKLYKKNDIAKITNETPTNIHFWHTHGLLPAEKIDGNNNYRMYDLEDTIERVHIIRTLKKFGRTIEQIKKLMPLYTDPGYIAKCVRKETFHTKHPVKKMADITMIKFNVDKYLDNNQENLFQALEIDSIDPYIHVEYIDIFVTTEMMYKQVRKAINRNPFILTRALISGMNIPIPEEQKQLQIIKETQAIYDEKKVLQEKLEKMDERIIGIFEVKLATV